MDFTYTRDDYLHKRCTLDEYYGQMVRCYMYELVKQLFRISHLIASYKQNKNFNTTITPLEKWDRCAKLLPDTIQTPSDDCWGNTLSTKTIVLKIVARRLVLRHLKKDE